LIARTWHGRVPVAKADAYFAYLQRTGIPDYKRTPGNRGVYVFRRIEGREATRLEDDLLVVPTPGHTRGHQVLLYAGSMLFTGDHLAWSPDVHGLAASRDVCWYSWKEQTRSMETLLAYRFEWVLPGHGHRHRCSSQEMHRHLERCVRSMKGERKRSTRAVS